MSAANDCHCAARHVESFRENVHELRIGGAVHGRRLQAHLERAVGFD
jgi:hypothetical protein